MCMRLSRAQIKQLSEQLLFVCGETITREINPDCIFRFVCLFFLLLFFQVQNVNAKRNVIK